MQRHSMMVTSGRWVRYVWSFQLLICSEIMSTISLNSQFKRIVSKYEPFISLNLRSKSWVVSQLKILSTKFLMSFQLSLSSLSSKRLFLLGFFYFVEVFIAQLTRWLRSLLGLQAYLKPGRRLNSLLSLLSLSSCDILRNQPICLKYVKSWLFI